MMSPSSPSSPTGAGERISIVIATRDRRSELVRTLAELHRAHPGVPVVVVDNASSDGTAAEVRRRWPGVRVVALDRNAGAAARNTGVRHTRTPYIAFSDDDSWWVAGALERAIALFERHPSLGLIAARTLVGAERRPDPVNRLMEQGPLAAGSEGPGVPILGFTACATLVRRRAFLDAGGFSDLLFFVGEEKLLAQDLASLGWMLRYVGDVTARHHPSKRRPPDLWRRGLEWRNRVLIAWLRRPVPTALRQTRDLFAAAVHDGAARRAVLPALRRIPAALRRRSRLPEPVESDLRLLERAVSGPD